MVPGSDGTPPMFSKEFPVIVHNACKSYFQRNTEHHVLVDLNLIIPQGTIYGLLGPSGCGKTTLLRCIVGRLRLDKGLVLTLNQVPGQPESDIPGPRLGYMPQEEALDGILKVKELLNYYGRILGVEEKTIKQKTKFLLDFLKLPTKNALFSTLSGGQKRRVSFAVALINDAELLILDEPTVGMDPILKESIWTYLLGLVRDAKKTVVITTHYIEEARAANFVGMMFEGQLLEEGSPELLISKYQKTTLEDVFLCACMTHKSRLGCKNDCTTRDKNAQQAVPLIQVQQNMSNDNTATFGSNRQYLRTAEDNYFEQAVMHISEYAKISSSRKIGCKTLLPVIHWTTLIAITHRNFIQLFRYPGLFLLIMVLPSFQIAMSGLALGRHIRSLNFGVLSKDTGDLANIFLSSLDSNLIIPKNVSSWDDVRHSIVSDNMRGVIHFGPEFSSSFLIRLHKSPFVSEETLQKSFINVSLDGTNFLVSETSRYYLSLAFERFIKKVLMEKNLNPNVGSKPVLLEEPIFGRAGDPYSCFIMPAFLTAASFFAQLGLSIIALFLDKEGGKLERILVAGVTSFEIIFGFMILQVIVLLAQGVITLVTALVIFDLSNQGSLMLVIALTIAQGICGITLGLLISATTSTFTAAAMIAVPIIVLSAGIGGYFWPIEAMSEGLKIFCQWMPFAVPANAMRHIMYRQWDLLHPEVQFAFGVTLAWTFLFLALAVISFRLQKKA